MGTYVPSLAVPGVGGGAGGLPPGVVAFWKLDNDLLDSSGNGYTITEPASAIPFDTTPTPPRVETYQAGEFTDSNYGDLDAAENDLDGSSWIGIEFYLYLDSFGASDEPVMWYADMTGGATWIQVLSTGAIKAQVGAGNITSAVSTIATGAWYHVALKLASGAGTSELFCSLASSVSQTPVATGVLSATTTTVTNMHMGRFIGATGFACNGHMSRFMIRNVELGTLPSV